MEIKQLFLENLSAETFFVASGLHHSLVSNEALKFFVAHLHLDIHPRDFTHLAAPQITITGKQI